jgi:hypothetical protein
MPRWCGDPFLFSGKVTCPISSDGSISTGLGVLGIAATFGKRAPFVGQIISGAAMVVDLSQTVEAVGS